MCRDYYEIISVWVRNRVYNFQRKFTKNSKYESFAELISFCILIGILSKFTRWMSYFFGYVFSNRMQHYIRVISMKFVARRKLHRNEINQNNIFLYFSLNFLLLFLILCFMRAWLILFSFYFFTKLENEIRGSTPLNCVWVML